MTSFWRLLAWANLFALYFFWTAPFAEIAVKFDLAGRAVGSISRENHAFYFGGVMLLVNFLLFGLFKASVGVRFLDIAGFPHKEYWLASPDRRLEAVAKMRNFLATLGIFVNVIFAQSQIFLYVANFYRAAFSPKILFLFLGAVLVISVAILIWGRSLFQPEV